MKTVEEIISKMEEIIKEDESEINALEKKYNELNNSDEDYAFNYMAYISEDISCKKNHIEMIRKQISWIKGS